MWYESFYSLVVTSGFLLGALYISGPFNYWDTGRWHRRFLGNVRLDQHLKRDHRLTGNYYVMSTLDSIPGEEKNETAQ